MQPKWPFHAVPSCAPWVGLTEHHRIKSQTICVVYILVSGEPTEDRLAQQANQRMQTIVASAGISQHAAYQIMQAENLIQFPEQKQPAI